METLALTVRGEAPSAPKPVTLREVPTDFFQAETALFRVVRLCAQRCDAYLAGMPVYRLFVLSPGDDAPVQRTFFNDQVAIGWAFRMTDAGGVDVWQGPRFVARLHAAALQNPKA